MDATQTDELWPRAAARLVAAAAGLAWVAPRDPRRTWLAEAVGPEDEPRTVVVKVSANPFAASRAAWAASTLSLLRERGAPVPALLWQARSTTNGS